MLSSAPPKTPDDAAARYGLLYLHGFLSSPESSKARLIRDWAHARQIAYSCPQLDIRPATAITQAHEALDQLFAKGYKPRILGSSLGGLYTVHLMETHPGRDQLRAAQLNPACQPARDLANAVGTHKAWNTGEALEFKPEYVAELADLERQPSALDRYLLVGATGDEVLSCDEMRAFYAGATQHIIEGSDHGISDFADHWPTVAAFLLKD